MTTAMIATPKKEGFFLFEELTWKEFKAVEQLLDRPGYRLSFLDGVLWNYTIGGYQVIKKWLSYREQKLLGRSLKQEEVIEVTQIARRIAAIFLLELELDANDEPVE